MTAPLPWFYCTLSRPKFVAAICNPRCSLGVNAYTLCVKCYYQYILVVA
jgi:hypothetical protein